ncbi:four helix bundle protein [Saccharicrinis aurantiacus]|uniref:four helix bundle protein n=1 Tax=Saccharicrinis aurantiacus TaxID=1849719 RepID=UPI000837D1CB|nr:four helix bundle protein [Saccharicrinis aurantiacus]
MNNFRELIVWQKSMVLVEDIYSVTSTFPSQEIYGLTSQVRRSAISVPSNIAEGFGRNQTRDYIRFLQISSGSLYELETQLEIAFRLGYIDNKKYIPINSLALEIEKMLSSLIRKLKEKLKINIEVANNHFCLQSKA